MQIAYPQLDQRLGSSRVTLRPAEKIAAKALLAVAVGIGLVAFAYYVLPRLAATGVAGYALGFLINAVTSASIIMPVPGMGILIVMSSELNPWMLAVVAAAGGALGELFGYWLGSQGRGPLAGSRMFAKIRGSMERHGGAVVFAFAAIPILPMDAAAMVAGATRYPVGRFLGYMAAGKALLLMAVFYFAGVVLG